MSTTICPNVTTLGDGRKKRAFNTDEKDIIKKSAEFFAKLKKMNGDVFADKARQDAADLARMAAEKEALIAHDLGDIIRLDPTQRDKLAGFFASRFGQKKDIVKTVLMGSEQLTTAGAIREGLVEAKRVAHGSLDEVGLLEKTVRIDGLLGAIRQHTKKLGLGEDTVKEVYREILEVGRTNQDLALYGNTPGLQNILTRRYEKFVKFAESKGISEDALNGLIDMSAGVAAAGDEMMAIGMSQGIHVEKLQGLGYFDRVSTDDFNKFMAAKAAKDQTLLEKFKAGGISLSGVFDITRTTNWYAPVHEEIGAALLGVTPEKLSDLLADAPKFRTFIDENLTVQQLDLLVESGLFKKLPMTGTEAFHYIVDQYELPFKHFNEMWKDDPYQVMAGMASNMKRAVGNAAVLKTALKDGLDAGWSIPASLAGPEHAGWVSTQGIDLARYGIESKKLPWKENLLVHPTVADQVRSVLELSTSPSKMGTAMSFLQAVQQFSFKARTVAGAPAYLTRILLGNTVALMSAGGNPINLLPSFMDMMRVGKKGFQVLDNTKVIGKIDGKEVTQLDAIRKLLLHRGEDVAPSSAGLPVGTVDWGSFNPTNSKRALTNMIAYAKAFGTDPLGNVIKGTDYAGYLINNMVKGAYSAVAVPSRMADMAARWALLRGELARGADVNWTDILRRMDDKFYMFDDLGTMNRNLATYAFPFSSWSMMNIPAMGRLAIQHPERIIAYNRLLQTMNYQNSPGGGQPGDPLPEAAFRSDFLSDYPITIGYDSVNGHHYSILPTGYDPILDVQANTVSTGDAFLRAAFGLYVGTSEEQTKLATEGQLGAAREYMSGLFARSYFAPVFDALGINLRQGKYAKPEDTLNTQHTWLGRPVSGIERAVLMALPPTKMLENSGLLGTPESKYYALQAQQPPLFRLLNSVGLNITTTDTLQNLGYSYSAMKKAANTMKGSIRKFSIENAGKSTSSMTPEEQKAYARYVDTYLQLQADLIRLDAYKAKHNITSKELEERLRLKQIKTSDTELPGADIIEQKLKEFSDEQNANIQR